MRILKLNEATARRFLERRRASDPTALAVAERIVRDVERHGDRALFAWTARLDKAKLTPRTLWVPRAEIHAARRSVAPELLRALEHAARNIRRVAERQLPRDWNFVVEPGVRVGQRVTPLDAIGCYVPGGRHSLVSTLLMAAVPAQVAGVRRIVVGCPKPNGAVLAAADLLGLTEIARIGGAQAIAAFAYGTRSIPRVDKIFGPGNRYVTAAKQIVSADCAIDLPAGPTEVLVMATRGNARFIAADLVAQAEHDPDARALFVTTSRKLAEAVQAEVASELARLPAMNPARKALAENGAILLAKSVDAAAEFANSFAAEHLSVPGGERALLAKLRAAGSIFVGPWSAQSIGDYASGSNHVLPTGGWARVRGGLSAADFVRTSSVQEISRAGFRKLEPVVRALANAEDLAAHARCVEVRGESARVKVRR
ncbi:MAG: histidinol dehydrogenase [Candidatus Acidiferrales bacterium]|jgi:histidinol dehydrogenase